MRILHVIATLKRRGGEVFASDLIRSLNDAGASQHAVVLHQSDEASIVLDTSTVMLGVEGWKAPGLRTSVGALRRLRHEVRSWEPDVIQAHGGEALKYLVLSGVSKDWPVVYRRIGAAPRWIRRGPRRLAHSNLMRRAARVVAVAEAVRRETVETFRVPPSRVIKIPNAVDASRMRPAKGRRETREALDIPPRSPVMLSLGALTWEKDPLAHLDVAETVAASHPDLVHLIVGAGSMAQEVTHAIHRRGLQDRVRVMGSRNDVPDLLAASDVLLFASRPDGMEGMPAVLIEAGMIGVPVAGYEIVGASEVVIHKATGLLSPYGNVKALAGNVVRLLRSSQMRRSMGRAAQAHCRSSFEIQVVTSEYLSTYRKVSEAW